MINAISAKALPVGRGPPKAQLSKVNKAGNRLKTNNAKATGMRATA